MRVGGDLTTYPQGGWSDPVGAGILAAGYDTVYVGNSFVVEVGIPGPGGFSSRFTSAKGREGVKEENEEEKGSA